jgi:hypothetical protein
MTIAFDAKSHSAEGTDPCSSLTWAHTCGASANFLLVAVGAYHAGEVTGVGNVKYNGVLMILIQTASADSAYWRVDIFGLENPSVGTHNIVVTMIDHATVARASACSYSGYRVGQPSLKDVSGGTGSLIGSPSVSVTPLLDNDWIFAACWGYPDFTSTNYTTRYIDSCPITGYGCLAIWDTNSVISPPASTTMTATHSSSTWCAVVVAFPMPQNGEKILELAFNQSIFTDRTALTWTDISSDLMNVKIKRGRKHQLDRIEAGTATFTLNNDDGNWWRNNTAGTFYVAAGKEVVKPWTPIRYNVIYNGTTYRRFYGVVESFNHSWLSGGGYNPIVELNCVDIFKRLARIPLDGPYIEQVSANRFTSVLNSINWPAGMRYSDGGTVDVIAYNPQQVSDRMNALEMLQKVAEAENGIIFQDGNGDIVFQDAESRQKPPYNTPLATFTDAGTDSKYIEPQLVDDDDFIYNEVRIAGTGITEQIVRDSTLQSTQGVCALERRDSLIAEDQNAFYLAYIFTKRFSDSILRVDSLVIYPDAGPDDLYPKVLGYGISIRIKVVLNSTQNPALINREYHIEGIEEDWSREEDLYIVRWQLWDVNQYRIIEASHTDSVYKEGPAYDYNAVQNAASGDGTRPDATTHYASNWKKDPSTFEIERIVFWFDLTSISASAVKSVLFGYYCAAKSSPAVDYDIDVVSGAGVSQPLIATDYHVLHDSTTILGSIANSETTEGEYNYFELNADGLAYVLTCIGGMCPLGIRVSNDIDSIEQIDNKQDIVGLTGGATPRIIIGVEL